MFTRQTTAKSNLMLSFQFIYKLNKYIIYYKMQDFKRTKLESSCINLSNADNS
jgi:hypothetical protein